jgi:colanic acid biosynthesis glycosyl transferase WcaI
LKLLIVTQYFWPETFRINDLAAGMVERGHDVTVLTGIPNYPGGRFFEGYGLFRRNTEMRDGIRIIRVPLIPRGAGGTVRLILNYASFAITASLLGPLRIRQKPDVILVFEPSPITVGVPARVMKAATRAPMLFWVQDLWPETPQALGVVRARWLVRAVESFVRWVYRGSDRILIQSEAFRDSVRRLLRADDAHRIRYFPNFAEAVYRPVPAEAAGADPPLPDGFRVTFAGNIGACQDFEVILSAAERLRDRADIRWVIAGNGRMLPWLVKEISQRRLDDRFHLLGQLPVEKMPGLFARSDILLATLKREPIFALTVPSKIQSYLACGRPIVVALDGEGSRVVDAAGAGIAAPAEDADALAHAVAKIYKLSAGARQAMGARGRAYFEQNFEREILLDRLELWMRELASSNGAQRAS